MSRCKHFMSKEPRRKVNDDPVQAYFLKMRDTPLLSREEEIILAKRIDEPLSKKDADKAKEELI